MYFFTYIRDEVLLQIFILDGYPTIEIKRLPCTKARIFLFAFTKSTKLDAAKRLKRSYEKKMVREKVLKEWHDLILLTT